MIDSKDRRKNKNLSGKKEAATKVQGWGERASAAGVKVHSPPPQKAAQHMVTDVTLTGKVASGHLSSVCNFFHKSQAVFSTPFSMFVSAGFVQKTKKGKSSRIQ